MIGYYKKTNVKQMETITNKKRGGGICKTKQIKNKIKFKMIRRHTYCLW